MSQKNSSVGPVVRDRVHLEGSKEEGRIGHRVGQVENALPALEGVLDSASVLDEMLGIELVDTLLLKDRAQNIRMEDSPDKRLDHHHKGQEPGTGVGNKERSDGGVKDDEGDKDIVGSEDVKVLEDDQIPTEVGVVHVFGSTGDQCCGLVDGCNGDSGGSDISGSQNGSARSGAVGG